MPTISRPKTTTWYYKPTTTRWTTT
jgi:hypothetical protein